MVKIRLKKCGRRNQRCYRIVAVDSRVKRDGRALEELGVFNPITGRVHLKTQCIENRLKDGAKPSKTVKNIFVKAKIAIS